MTPQKVVFPAVFGVCGCAALSGMIWTIVSDPTLVSTLWPSDIHRLVLRYLGGESQPGPGGEHQLRIHWLPVFLRCLIALVLGIVSSALLKGRWKRSPKSGASKQTQHLSLLLNDFAEISRSMQLAWIWLVMWYVLPFLSVPSLSVFFFKVTPLCLALILAHVANRILSPGCDRSRARASEPPGQQPDTASSCFIIVVAAALVWECTSFWMNQQLYTGLLVPHGDSAMYEEHLWNVWHGKGFRSYLDQGLFLGEHIQVIHLLLLPLHRIWPSYLLMELAASVSLALCVIPIHSIARRHTGCSRAGMWLGLAWLMYFPMHFLDIAIDLKTLRPSCYGMPFLFWGIDLAERRSLKAATVCLAIALSTQEDFALIIGPIGLVLYMTSFHSARCSSVPPADTTFPPDPDRWAEPAAPPEAADNVVQFRRWSLGVLIVSVAYVLAAVLVIIPAFRGGDAVHYSRYFGDLGSSPGDLIRATIRTPAKVLSVLFSLRTCFYVLLFCVPLGLFPLRGFRVLAAGIITFTMLSLIQLGNQPGDEAASDDEAPVSNLLTEVPPIPYHHFHAPLLPVIFWAAAAGLKTRQGQNTRRPSWVNLDDLVAHRARLIFLCSALTAVNGSLMPCGAAFWSTESRYGWKNLYVGTERGKVIDEVLAMIPPASRVASTDFVHTRLTHFERSYDYSDYLRAVNNYKPGVPPDTEFIVIDLTHPYSRIRSLEQIRELQTEPEHWTVLRHPHERLFAVLKRNPVPVAR